MFLPRILVPLGLILLPAVSSTVWLNSYDNALSKECPARQHIYHIKSLYSNSHNDRKWAIYCREEGWVSTDCKWKPSATGYGTSYEQTIDYSCDSGYVLTGLASVHHNGYWHNDIEDRKWRLKCCKATVYPAMYCGKTEYVNGFNLPMNYMVPVGVGIKGIHASWNGQKNDREYGFRTCVHREISCNGRHEFCKLKFNQATFVGTHNSGSGFDGHMYYGSGIIATDCTYRNQALDFKRQLQMGARFFDLDTKMNGNEVRLGHGKDIFAYTKSSLSTGLGQIQAWMNEPLNRREVIVIRGFDTHNTEQAKWLKAFKDTFTGTSGKVGMNTDYTTKGRWPTLEEAIDQNKRVFVFAANALCGSTCRSNNKWVHNWDSLVGDTWQKITLSSSCSGIVDLNKANCAEIAPSKQLVLVSNFGSWGICILDMAAYCNTWVYDSMIKCREEMLKQNKVVNFVAIDYMHVKEKAVDLLENSITFNTMNRKQFGL